MPNWIKNKLFIHGESDKVKQCTLDIASDSEHISFEKTTMDILTTSTPQC